MPIQGIDINAILGQFDKGQAQGRERNRLAALAEAGQALQNGGDLNAAANGLLQSGDVNAFSRLQQLSNQSRAAQTQANQFKTTNAFRQQQFTHYQDNANRRFTANRTDAANNLAQSNKRFAAGREDAKFNRGIAQQGLDIRRAKNSTASPRSKIAKLTADFKNGLIDKDTFTASRKEMLAGKSGGFKTPTGFMVDPKNPGSVVPIPGGPQDPNTPTSTVRTAAVKVNNAASAIQKGLDSYENLIQKFGTEIVPGKGKDALLVARRSIQLQMKELFNLGVLNGPDLTLMDELLIDPTSITTAAANALPESFGGSEIQGRAKSNIAQLRTMLEELRKSQTPQGFRDAPTQSQQPFTGQTQSGAKWSVE